VSLWCLGWPTWGSEDCNCNVVTCDYFSWCNFEDDIHPCVSIRSCGNAVTFSGIPCGTNRTIFSYSYSYYSDVCLAAVTWGNKASVLIYDSHGCLQVVHIE
jgi:hypothetical protein